MNKFHSTSIHTKTKPFITTILSLIFIILPYGLIWILLGEGREIFFVQNNINIDISINWFNPLKRMYSWEFYTVFFLFLLLPIFIFIFGRYLFKIIEIDSIPFFYLSCGIWISIMITGIFPQSINQNKYLELIIIGKFIFIILFSLIFFLFFNFIINIIILKSKNIKDFFIDFKKENDLNIEILKSQKSILDKRKIEKETSWEV